MNSRLNCCSHPRLYGFSPARDHSRRTPIKRYTASYATPKQVIHCLVAHIRETGTRNGTISNDSGGYSLTLTTIPAEVLVSYIGYHSQRIAVTADSPEENDVALAPSPVVMETIVVYSEDEAARIMKKVIERKKDWYPKIKTLASEAYTRISMANDKRIVFIGESISNVYNDREHGIREIVRYKRQTENIKEAENFAQARMTPYLYDDDVEIFGFNCIGPTHPDCCRSLSLQDCGKTFSR